MTQRPLTRLAFAAAVLAVGVAHLARERAVLAQVRTATADAPLFQADPWWPKQLPNHWIVGAIVGLDVDAKDNIWVIHRPSVLTDLEKAATFNPPRAECCVPAPQVLQFDQAGNLLRSWGGPGPGYEWPQSEHGIHVDYKENVWLGGSGERDAQILKFTKDGKFLMQIGRQGKSGGSNDTVNLGRPAKIYVDPSTNEAYVADGYGNRRIIVFDADTGAYKRHWGAYGTSPNDDPLPAYNPENPLGKQFRGPVHCVDLSKDGLVYVCDRLGNRIQVFKKDGTFVKETSILPKTLVTGSTCDSDFSADARQRYMYVADCINQRVHILLRDSLQWVSSFGDGGRGAGQFFLVHNLAVDSKGNMYTGETLESRRMQRFLYKGVRPPSARK